MDQEEIITAIIDAIGHACPVNGGVFSLCVSNGTIVLCQGDTAPSGCWRLAHLDQNEVNYGLRIEKWDLIEERINTLRKAGHL